MRIWSQGGRWMKKMLFYWRIHRLHISRESCRLTLDPTVYLSSRLRSSLKLLTSEIICRNWRGLWFRKKKLSQIILGDTFILLIYVLIIIMSFEAIIYFYKSINKATFPIANKHKCFDSNEGRRNLDDQEWF